MEFVGESNQVMELQTLIDRLKQTQDKISHWLKDETKQFLRAKANKYKLLLESDFATREKCKACISSTKEDIMQTEERVKEYAQQALWLKTELEELYKISLKKIEEERDKCEVEITTIKKHIQETIEDTDELVKAKQKLQYLQKAGGLFENCLGMTFRKTTDNRMQVLFTNINEKDPQQEFYFFVQIQGLSRKYVVTDPGPAIDGLDEIIAELNATNNIRKFIIEIRNKFKNTLHNS